MPLSQEGARGFRREMHPVSLLDPLCLAHSGHRVGLPLSLLKPTIISSTAQITALGPPNRQHNTLPATQNGPATKKKETGLTKRKCSARSCGFDLKLNEGPEHHSPRRKTLPPKYPHFGVRLAQHQGICSKKKEILSKFHAVFFRTQSAAW